MRILVVEDEKKVRDFIKRGLKEEGYSVDVAQDGQEGYFMAGTNDYDAMILDVMLPKMDGIMVCRRLRAEQNRVPILMLTAKDTVEDKVQGLDSGANDYLTKPFAFEELLARVRSLLRSQSTGAEKLEVADLFLDLATRRVYRAGKEIEMTNKEYALLEYLMRNVGAIVTRTMISEHVWDIHFDSFTNVIDVHINYLRKKIDQGHARPLIHTVRGRGYSLHA